MKYSELKRLLRKHDATLYKHGKRHDIWRRGNLFTSIPRHNGEEVKLKTLNTILSDLSIKVSLEICKWT